MLRTYPLLVFSIVPIDSRVLVALDATVVALEEVMLIGVVGMDESPESPSPLPQAVMVETAHIMINSLYFIVNTSHGRGLRQCLQSLHK